MPTAGARSVQFAVLAVAVACMIAPNLPATVPARAGAGVVAASSILC
jgi:hypothetical protein